MSQYKLFDRPWYFFEVGHYSVELETINQRIGCYYDRLWKNIQLYFVTGNVDLQLLSIWLGSFYFILHIFAISLLQSLACYYTCVLKCVCIRVKVWALLFYDLFHNWCCIRHRITFLLYLILHHTTLWHFLLYALPLLLPIFVHFLLLFLQFY